VACIYEALAAEVAPPSAEVVLGLIEVDLVGPPVFPLVACETEN